MKRPFPQTLLAFLALPWAAQALDLTPRHTFRVLEGFKIPIIQFADGNGFVSYQPPSKWRVSGGETELTLYPQDHAEAVMKMQVLRRPRTEGAGASSPEDLKKWSLQFLPSTATEVNLLSTRQSPFTLGTLGCLELIFTYLEEGRRLTRSLAIVELNAQQRFVVSVLARAGDFEAVHEEAISSMFSWQQ